MLLVTAFCSKDAELAANLFEWCAELSGRQSHPCLLVSSVGMDEALVQRVVIAAKLAFENVSRIQPKHPNEQGWPASPNHLFRCAANYVQKTYRKPFFWLEPDCTPLVADWADKLEAEYVASKKPYMGFRRDIPVPHLTGVAIYPSNIVDYNPDCLRPHKNEHGVVPFDCISGGKTLRHAHITRLIYHDWGTKDHPPTFPDQASADEIPSEAALHHRCKDGSLVQRLRERRLATPKKPTMVQKVKKAIFGEKIVAVIQLGRYGDIINILPICKKLHDEGNTVHFIVSRDYASVLDGVSYVTPEVLDIPFDQLAKAKEYATKFEKVVCTQVHGVGHEQERKMTTFNIESWRMAGMEKEFHNLAYRPVFDRRNPAREQQLLQRLSRKPNRPKIAVNVTKGHGAPLANGEAVLKALQTLKSHEIVDISTTAQRIYDLIGVMEACELIVTIDTATLHLAAATDKPVFALLADTPWTHAAVRYNCAGTMHYRDVTPERVLAEVRKALGHEEDAATVERILAKTFKTNDRILLPDVTLWGCCWSTDKPTYLRTLRVMRYCLTRFCFGRAVFFAYMPPWFDLGFYCEFFQIPKLDMAQWNIFHNRIVPQFLFPEPCEEFALSVHDDGFPLDKSQWTDEFLNYDYVGAPWRDGDVGNGGFCLESAKFMRAKMNLPFATEPLEASDRFVCRTHKRLLEKAGCRFAPFDLSERFSTEETGHRRNSLGYHGRRVQPTKHMVGWRLIRESEKV